MGRGVDAAIFGSGAVTYIAAIGGGRSTVPLTRGAGICGFPFASSFLLALSFFPVSLDPTRSEEKEIPSETRRNFGGCHAQLTQEPTKQRRFIDTHFWLKNADFLRCLCKFGVYR